MPFQPKNGFTLVELIVTLAIFAILATIAIPYFQEIKAKQEVNAITNKLISTIQLAKSQASIYHSNVVICPSQNKMNCQTNQWTAGLLIFLDSNKNRQIDTGEKIIYTESTNLKYGHLDWRGTLNVPSLTFQAENGLPIGSNGSFYYCSIVSDHHQKLVLSAMGHMRIENLSIC
ncbi:fimbrial biogenesis protein FimT [Acinetobacter sp. ANC 4169]|jgi:type IV fimbrial biogenesis protein FimT|uniref:GspH/FimT family pseudopilin n=1 Tax=Acinetobacter sp. ANC 4169 TaxID=1977879 RepID=UPI000A355C54|nr:GspH/FimT family pseudopilin [Acinetobacter sp. ANC 4169]OTG75153.1 fimbrial biogenesis protein FimT [Acinetobacter sp. ANC 4169]